ncbi:MAG: hypothetical protein R6U44_02180 [Archaeoglobaceae archaeon]
MVESSSVDIGYKFDEEKAVYKFINQILDGFEVDGVNYFADPARDPLGVVVLRFSGQLDLSEIDQLASSYGGSRMYLPGNWRNKYSDYECCVIETP